MRRLVLTYAAVAPVLFGAVANVAVRGVTNTQVILTYTAPDANACSVAVSESSTLSPLVHDVDPTLFAGSNLDSRAESFSSGLSRVFVLGKRRAEKASNGHWYSRALQTVTTHYYKITCGSSVATGRFVTANLALGNTYNEAIPGDPAAGLRPYYATMGSYAWPEFTKWDPTDPTARAETVVDPQTGVLLKRIGMPRDATIDFYPGTGDHNFSAVLSPDGAWNLGTTVWSRANGKLVQIAVGSGSATVTTSTPHGLTQDSRVTISGLASGNGVYSVNSPGSTTFVISQGSLPSNTVLTDATLQVTALAGTADNGVTTNFTGTNSNFLLLRDDFFSTGVSLADPTLPTDYLTLSLKAWCQGTCAGEDAKVQACLTINGVNCWPTNATAKYQEAALGTSQTNGFTTFGSTTPIIDSWTPAGFQPLNKSDLSMRLGQANIDTSGNMTWTSGATYFNPNWTTGSRITVAGVLCTVRGASSTGQMAIDPASCATPLALPLTNAAWSGNNLGFLIRKKTANTDTIRLQFAKYTSGASQHMTWTSSGAAQVCSETLVQNSVTGEYGYHCQNYANLPMLYWVEQKTARANYLGIVAGASAGGLDGFGNCYGNGTLTGTTPTAPERYYCSADDNETPSKKVLAECTINTTNQSGSLSISCRNLTPGTQGKDLGGLMSAFTANDTPTFDTKFTCNASGVQGTKLVISCGKSVQDTLAWVAMFDPLKVGTAPGCVGGGQPGCIVAAMSTWAKSPARWCTLHTLFVSGATDAVWIAGKYFSPNFPPQLADGPYTSNVVAGTLGATPAIAAGTGACPPGSFGCDQVTVDGEPCDATPAAGEAAGSPCPKNPAYVYLQDAQVGDYVSVDSEYMTIVAKAGNVWTVQRGVNNPPVAHSSLIFSEQCKSKDPSSPGSNWSWTWDTALDPHGANADGTTLRIVFDYDHPNPRPSVTVGGMPFYDTSCISGVGPCYGVRDGVGALGDPPNRLSALAPLFSGTNGVSQFIERSQDHPSRLQDAAPPGESKWFLDGRPLTSMIDLSDAVIRLSGDLYRMTSTTTDGDNLSKLGYNVYVERTSPTTLLAAGNCSAANPCSIWNDTQYAGSIKNSCTITVTGGTGAVWVSRLSTGELAVTRSSALSVTSDLCPVSVGSGYPGGSFSFWSWSATSGVWAQTGSDERAGSSGFFGLLNRKQQPTWAYCGTQPMIDVSSAAIGDVIGDSSPDGYKYCVARKGGECRAASKVGDIYMNCPNATPRFEGSYGCHWYQDTQDVSVDMCVGNHSAYLDAIDQIGFAKTDFKGALGRALTKGLGHYKVYDPYFHGKATPDAEWVMFLTMWVNGGSSEWLAAKTPPYPPSDTVDRSTFIPVPVKLAPPPGLAVNNVVVQFGYAENGSPSGFYCTTRQEKCLASKATVPTIPFLYASEGTGGVETGITGLSCASGCTVAVPALSQRMLYYQVIYRNAANQTLAKGQIEVTAVP